jgi:predicted nucleotidyltransferase
MTSTDRGTREVIQGILDKLVADYAPQKVILFGSCAWGDVHPDSDIDLFIVKETSARFIDRWTTVQQLLTGLHRAVPVETLVLTPEEIESRLTVGDQFIREILERGEVLYAA